MSSKFLELMKGSQGDSKATEQNGEETDSRSQAAECLLMMNDPGFEMGVKANDLYRRSPKVRDAEHRIWILGNDGEATQHLRIEDCAMPDL
jgi:hypothetical protein